jgi:hypothetical protein
MFIFGAAALGPADDSIAPRFERMRLFFAGKGMKAIARCGAGNVRMGVAEARAGSAANRQLVDEENCCIVGFGSLFQTKPARRANLPAKASTASIGAAANSSERSGRKRGSSSSATTSARNRSIMFMTGSAAMSSSHQAQPPCWRPELAANSTGAP